MYICLSVNILLCERSLSYTSGITSRGNRGDGILSHTDDDSLMSLSDEEKTCFTTPSLTTLASLFSMLAGH